MSRFVSLPDVELHVIDEGAGAPLVFLHGFPVDHRMWEAQLENFSKTERVIAPDLRGFGQSEDSEGPVTMEQFADDVAALLDQLDVREPVTLCGLSMGGYIAFQFWKRHPERLARLILCDTRAVADTSEAKQGRLASSERVLQHGPAFLANTMPEKMYSTATFENHPDLIAETQQVIMQNSPLGISGALLGMAQRPDVTSWLPEIQVPTLILVGEEDSVSPVDEMRSIAEALPQATFVVISQAGHMAPHEQPEQVNQAIQDFLKRTATE